MSKAIFLMDMPDDCTMCKFWNTDDDECYATGSEELSLNSEEAKPDWCLLRELPEKMKVCGRYPQPDGITPSYKIGWDTCLDEILKDDGMRKEICRNHVAE